MATRHPTRPRRIDDALSQLIDSLTPPLPLSSLNPNTLAAAGDAEEALATAEEQRHHQHLQRAWRIIDSHPTPATDPTSPTTTGGLGINRVGGGENINNAPDLIKRKLLRENASPDKAVRFSNLYSRLLTQPVLSQKWAILYLLYRLSGSEDGFERGEQEDGEGERSRSPLMEEGSLQNLLMKGRSGRPGGLRTGDNSEDDGPAVSSSASQRPGRIERAGSLRRDLDREGDREREADRDHGRSVNERPRDRASRVPADSGWKEKATEEPRVPAQQSFSDPVQKTPASEAGLLRDLPYNLQGLSSSNLEFASSSVLRLPPSLPIPMVSLLNTLAEPCLLYRGLSNFVESSDGGLVSQSLRSALASELRSYLGLVATLEGEIRRALAENKDSDDPKSVCKGGVTLKRCVVWTRDATMALRLMSLIVEESRSKYH